MSKKKRMPCDVKTCRSNKGQGYCRQWSIWIAPDDDGRPTCQTYKRQLNAALTAYDVAERDNASGTTRHMVPARQQAQGGA